MKRENLANWMRGGIILISVLVMGLSSCECPSLSDITDASNLSGENTNSTPTVIVNPTPTTPDSEIPLDSPFPEGEFKLPPDPLSPLPRGPYTDVRYDDKGQIFILSLNALAGKNDSDPAVSGLKEGVYSSTNRIYMLDPVIMENIRKYQPGGIYISAENLRALAKEVGAYAYGPGSLKDPLKKLIEMLRSKEAISIRPLIVTQEGGQFQRLLTGRIGENGEWKKSLLGTKLGLDGFPSVVGDRRDAMKKAPDGTPYTWGIAESSPTSVKLLLHQLYDLGFTLNYWLVGGTLRGPGWRPWSDDLKGLSRIQTSANVLGYKATSAQKFFPMVMDTWRKEYMVTLIGDFPGKSFADHVAKAPNPKNWKHYLHEMEWPKPPSPPGLLQPPPPTPSEYFKEEAVAAVDGRGIDYNNNRGRDRLYHYAKAIEAGVDIVALSQDPLYEDLTQDPPWKSSELISVLRTEMGFGEGVVMVGDRTALIRDKHPKWTVKGWTGQSPYVGIGREMSTVVQLDSGDVEAGLRAGVDLFHLWRIHTTVNQGNTPKTIVAKSETALETIDAILGNTTLDALLKESRERVLRMKRKKGYRS